AETASEVLQHAACCDHCGPILNRYLQEFSEGGPPEVEALVDQLPVSEPEWPRQKAREIVRNSFRRTVLLAFGRRFSNWRAPAKVPAIAWGTAAVLLVAAAIARGPALKERLEIHNESRRVAAAYAEKRTSEPRLTGVDPGPYQKPSVTLGQEDQADELNRPALSEAQSKLSRKLTSSDDLDPHWLQIKGRLLLLKDPRNAQIAEETFQQAQGRGLRNLGLEIDLAVSSFERDSKSDNPNLSKTIDQLKKVLQSSTPAPNREERSVALFDLALAYEKTKAWDLALATWQDYLVADPSGPWADEARKHLAEAQAKVSRQQSYKDPAEFNRHSFDPEVKNDVEQYQEIALARWLPTAIEQPEGDSARATRAVAGLMAEEHSDPLWKDFVDATGRAELPAVRALSAALVANQNDQHHQAVFQFPESGRLFSGSPNTPRGP